METSQFPFSSAWWGSDLGTHRPCDSTYCRYPYDSLPPIDTSLFRGEFQWLTPLTRTLDATMQVHRRKQEESLKSRMDSLTTQAAPLGLTLPPAFVKFMSSLPLQDSVPSCTACYFSLASNIVKSAAGDGYFIRFLNDQQDVLMWYLYLDGKGNQAVVVSDLMFDDEEGVKALATQWQRTTSELTTAYTLLCAPDFESFIYRFWLENHIWFALEEGDGTLTAAQRSYVQHYQK